MIVLDLVALLAGFVYPIFMVIMALIALAAFFWNENNKDRKNDVVGSFSVTTVVTGVMFALIVLSNAFITGYGIDYASGKVQYFRIESDYFQVVEGFYYRAISPDVAPFLLVLTFVLVVVSVLLMTFMKGDSEKVKNDHKAVDSE